MRSVDSTSVCCQKRAHKKCSERVAVTSAGRTSVDKFCCLCDMLSVDGDADAAVEARIRIGWNKFRQLVPLLTIKDVSLVMKVMLYSS